MHRWAILLILLSLSPSLVRASGEGGPSQALPDQESESNSSADEGEEKGIIPRSAPLMLSTGPVTPISSFPERAAYDQAHEEMAQAEALFAKGEWEAASDTALEAYDDFMEIHRRKKKDRKKLLAERHRAATIYVQAGIHYILDFVNKGGRQSTNLEEGRSRLEDLRDVARDYPELNDSLNLAIQQLSPTSAAPAK